MFEKENDYLEMFPYLDFLSFSSFAELFFCYHIFLVSEWKNIMNQASGNISWELDEQNCNIDLSFPHLILVIWIDHDNSS